MASVNLGAGSKVKCKFLGQSPFCPGGPAQGDRSRHGSNCSFDRYAGPNTARGRHNFRGQRRESRVTGRKRSSRARVFSRPSNGMSKRTPLNRAGRESIYHCTRQHISVRDEHDDTLSASFQAGDEGSIPFTRSGVFSRQSREYLRAMRVIGASSARLLPALRGSACDAV